MARFMFIGCWLLIYIGFLGWGKWIFDFQKSELLGFLRTLLWLVFEAIIGKIIEFPGFFLCLSFHTKRWASLTWGKSIYTKRWGKLFNTRQVEAIKLRLKVVDFGWNVYQEARGGMYSQAISTPILEVSCYYNHIIKVFISMEFLLCDQSVHFNKIYSFFFILLNSLIVYFVGLNFDCNVK